MSRECRELFIDTAFETIKDRISLSLNTSSYDDIITSINEDNKLYIAIFFSGGVTKAEMTVHPIMIDISTHL